MGKLRINRKRRSEAYVDVDGLPTDVRLCMPRATVGLLAHCIGCRYSSTAMRRVIAHSKAIWSLLSWRISPSGFAARRPWMGSPQQGMRRLVKVLELDLAQGLVHVQAPVRAQQPGQERLRGQVEPRVGRRMTRHVQLLWPSCGSRQSTQQNVRCTCWCRLCSGDV